MSGIFCEYFMVFISPCVLTQELIHTVSLTLNCKRESETEGSSFTQQRALISYLLRKRN